MPLVAEAYYQQISSYFDQHADVRLTSGQICYYRFCYTLDTFIAKRIISQRGCSRSQRNPLINDRWEANKHQPSSYPMVI